MQTYNFDLQMTIGKWETKVSSADCHGSFEHDDLGEGGSLTFETLESGELLLVDYDGVFELPAKVVEALKKLGINTSYVDEEN